MEVNFAFVTAPCSPILSPSTMPEEKKKIGQEFGEIRQSVDVDALNKYLSCECGNAVKQEVVDEL